MKNKYTVLLLLACAELFGMAVWFSASAVTPTLTTLWHLDDSAKAALLAGGKR